MSMRAGKVCYPRLIRTPAMRAVAAMVPLSRLAGSHLDHRPGRPPGRTPGRTWPPAERQWSSARAIPGARRAVTRPRLRRAPRHLVLADDRRQRVHQLRGLRRGPGVPGPAAAVPARQRRPVGRHGRGARGPGQRRPVGRRGSRVGRRRAGHGPGGPRRRGRAGRAAGPLHCHLPAAHRVRPRRLRLDPDQRRVPVREWQEWPGHFIHFRHRHHHRHHGRARH